jgi:hypothetical protein
VVFIYTVSAFARDGRANGGGRHQVLGANPDTVYINTTFSPHHSHFIHQAFEDGPDRGFRNVGQYKPEAGKSPKS